MGRTNKLFKNRNNALVIGFCASLLGSLLSGIIAVMVDFDHFICALDRGIPLYPVKNIYGCKIWHNSLPWIGGIGLGCTVALGIGLYIFMVGKSNKSTTKHYNIKS